MDDSRAYGATWGISVAAATVYSADPWGNGNSDVDQQRQCWAEAECLVRLVAQAVTVVPSRGAKQELNRKGQWLVRGDPGMGLRAGPQVASQTVDDPGRAMQEITKLEM